MIKIQNNIPTREAIPAFLQGLAPESLVDLSWTDPALGVSDCKWLPEQDASPELGQFEVYGEEAFTLGDGVVIVTRAVLPMPQEQIDVLTSQQASQVRAERNTKLSASDWTQVADAPVDKATWAAYRQELRDVTSQAGFPWNIVWPTTPTF